MSLTIPTAAESRAITVVPSKGPLQEVAVSEPQALINFHQKRNGTKGHVCYWEPSNGTYRVILPTEMRATPDLTVQFIDRNITAVPEPVRQRVANVEVKFRAKGPGGFIKTTSQPIATIEFSAEL